MKQSFEQLFSKYSMLCYNKCMKDWIYSYFICIEIDYLSCSTESTKVMDSSSYVLNWLMFMCRLSELVLAVIDYDGIVRSVVAIKRKYKKYVHNHTLCVYHQKRHGTEAENWCCLLGNLMMVLHVVLTFTMNRILTYHLVKLNLFSRPQYIHRSATCSVVAATVGGLWVSLGWTSCRFVSITMLCGWRACDVILYRRSWLMSYHSLVVHRHHALQCSLPNLVTSCG